MGYIEREAVKEKLSPMLNDPEAIDFWEWQCSEIDDIPDADVRPVVRGRWIERTHKLYDGRYAYSIECTHCHEVFTEVDLTIKPTKRNFCPDCGAKMDGGQDDV